MTVSYPARVTSPRALRRASRANVLVIAPHPDDDVLGCGGTLVRLVARRARIRVVYVTDGSASHVKSKRFPPEVLRGVREAEARAALRALGITVAPVFLRAPDGGLAQLAPPVRHRIVAAIARRIARHRTHVVFTPWLRDPHSDHVATAAIVQDAMGLGSRRPLTYMYGVWLPVRGAAADQPRSAEARARDVRLEPHELRRKQAAIAEHRSQTGALIDDDPDGFRIDAELLARWLAPVERFYVAGSPRHGDTQR